MEHKNHLLFITECKVSTLTEMVKVMEFVKTI